MGANICVLPSILPLKVKGQVQICQLLFHLQNQLTYSTNCIKIWLLNPQEQFSYRKLESHVHNERTVPIIMACGRMHCACRKRPYFHFRSKMWCYLRFSRPRFHKMRKNFGDSRTFKADIGLLNICMGFQDLLA